MASGATDLGPWLQPFGLIDSDSEAVKTAVAQATQGCTESQTEKAVAIYRYVRDRIMFGFSAGFDQLSASQVLSARRGFCNPKSTLFVAMLRAAGIPARQHMASINMNVLTGLGPPTDVYGDHALSEVYLGGRWLLVDSYTVDPLLYKAGMAAICEHGLSMGFGVHADGVNDWDGTGHSFVQYVMPAASSAQPGSGTDRAFSGAPAQGNGPASDRDFGVVQDLQQSCQDVSGSPFANLRSGLGRVAFGTLGSRYCNWQIQRLRSAAVAESA